MKTIVGKKRLCKSKQSNNDDSASEISFSESDKKVQASNENDSDPCGVILDKNLMLVIHKDDSTELCKLLLSNLNYTKNMKRKRSSALETAGISLVDLLIVSSHNGAFDCANLLLSLQSNGQQKDDYVENALNKWILTKVLKDKNQKIDNYDWSLSNTDLSNVKIDVSNSGLQFIRGMVRGKLSPTETSPLLVAIKNHQLNICKLICEVCPIYSIALFSSQLPVEQDVMGQEDNNEEDQEGISILFSLVHEHDDITLTTCLLAIDQSLNAMMTRSSHTSEATATSYLQNTRTLELIRSRNETDSSTLLHWAVEEGHLPFVTALVDLDPQLISLSDSQGMCPLHSACMMDKAEITGLLLDRGAKPLALDKDGWSAFMYALYSGSTECALALLRRGDDEALAYLGSLGDVLNGREADARLDEVLESLATVPEFHRLLNDLLHGRPDLMIGDGRLSFVAEFPFLLDLRNKLVFANASLTTSSHQADGVLNRLPILHTHHPSVRIALPRNSPWDAFMQVLAGDRSVAGERSDDEEVAAILSPAHKAQLILRSSIILQFIESGTEAGIGFGVEREVLGAISRDLTSAAVPSGLGGGCKTGPLFTSPGDTGDVYIPSALTSANRSAFEYFGYFVGHLLLRKIGSARACVSGQEGRSQDVLSFNIAPVFWKLVLQDKSLTVEDLAGYDAMLYQSLRYLLDNPHAQDLCLTFTAMNDTEMSSSSNSNTSASASASAVVELVKGGARRKVTDKNKAQYVDLLLQKKLLDRMDPQADLVRQGIVAVLPATSLEQFSVSEIGQLLEGTADIDVSDWRRHAVCQGWDAACRSSTTRADQRGSQQESPVLKWFWDLVASLDSDKRGLLLRFCTGCSRIPAAGFQSLSPPFTISRVPMDQQRSLPTASTCFNLLKLPEYPTQAQLRRSVMTAVLLGNEGFSFT